MKKKKLKLDLKKITIARLSDKSLEKIKGGTFSCGGLDTRNCSTNVGCGGGTGVYGWVNGVYECLRDS